MENGFFGDTRKSHRVDTQRVTHPENLESRSKRLCYLRKAHGQTSRGSRAPRGRRSTDLSIVFREGPENDSANDRFFIAADRRSAPGSGVPIFPAQSQLRKHLWNWLSGDDCPVPRTIVAITSKDSESCPFFASRKPERSIYEK